MTFDIDIAGISDVPDSVIEIIQNVCSACSKKFSIDSYAGICLTDDEGIREYNRIYRDIDKPTDVLSFPMIEGKNGIIVPGEFDKDPKSGETVIGDIIISVQKAYSQAKEYGHGFDREIAFLTCHGMLHLLGFDHMKKEDEEDMTLMQEEILSSLGYKRLED